MPLDPLKRVYDPDENVTRVWDKSGFVGLETGNTQAKLGASPIYTGNLPYPKDPPITRDKDGSIDWGKTGRDWVSDIIPSAIQMAAPEFKGLGVLGNIMAKMGISFGANTLADQVINTGQNKPLLNSAVDSGINSLLGIGLPEGLNYAAGLRIPPRTSTTTTNRGAVNTEMFNSSAGNTNRTSNTNSVGDSSSTGSTSGSTQTSGEGNSSSTRSWVSGIPLIKPQVLQGTPGGPPLTRGPDGRMQKAKLVDMQLPGFRGESVSKSTNNTSGTSNLASNNQREGKVNSTSETTSNSRNTSQGSSTGTKTTGPTTSITTGPRSGWLNDLVDILQGIHSTSTPINPWKAALIGLGINAGADTVMDSGQK